MRYRVKFVDDALLLTKSGRQQDWAVGAVRCTPDDGPSEGAGGSVPLAEAVDSDELVMVCLIRRTGRTMSDEDAEAVLELALQGFCDLILSRPELLVPII